MQNKILAIIIILVFCLNDIALANHIELEPLEPGQNYCLMKIDEVKTFTATGLGWDLTKEASIPDYKIEGIIWKFNKKLLKKISSLNQNITIKAIRPGAGKLIVKGEIQGKKVTECIGIVITR